ncbi:hypothetical protein C2S52_018463 [Perilla frutescens var. hirtella]|nr:hypothetical protein C2S52_018463 [Perilla frutescens var. hirtella]KAH6812165.1 hypothetical protein C2S51_025927 [Perilla frutescens var. frutescens]
MLFYYFFSYFFLYIHHENELQKLNRGLDVSTQLDGKNSKSAKNNEHDDDEDDEVRAIDSTKKMWRVPRRKRGDEEPGFNLDYLPPKTHPPVHN